MSSFVRLTPLSGALDESHLCYLLEMDEARILLDCGWSESLHVKQIEYLAQVCKSIDAILLSHGDLEHIGAIVYAFQTYGIRCPIYATTPVHDMGRLTLLELVASKTREEEFNLFTMQSVNSCFNHMTLLRYSQPIKLSGRCSGITITPFNSGRTIGGTVWKIKKLSEEIVYAVDYNHRKERHLNGSALINNESLTRPTLLITDTYNALTKEIVQRKDRETQLIDAIVSILQNGGNVLIPTDCSLRVLELCYLLDQFWGYHRLSFPILFLSEHGADTFNLARSMLEWMGDSITQAFASRELPFDFRHVKPISSLADLERFPGSQVILAPYNGIETGFSRQVLESVCEDAKNLLLLLERGPVGSLSSELYQRLRESSESLENFEKPLNMKRKVPLEGEELLAFQHEQSEKEAQKTRDELNLESDDDSDMEVDGDEMGYSSFDIPVRGISTHTTGSGNFFKAAQSFRMFPLYEERSRMDEYGEAVDWQQLARLNNQKVPDENETLSPTIKEVEVSKPVVPEIPCKYIQEQVHLTFHCKIQFIDFEGRSDGRSMRNILQQLAPKKLILIHGSQEATSEFHSYCLELDSLTKDIFTPRAGECVNVSVASDLYQVVLTDSLMSSMRLAQYKDRELSYISGTVRRDDPQALSSPTEATPAAVGPQEGRLSLETQDPIHQKYQSPTLIGDLKLSQIRNALQTAGFITSISQGVLIVGDNGALTIRKSPDGSFVVTGKIGRDYFKVRDYLYQLQTVIY